MITIKGYSIDKISPKGFATQKRLKITGLRYMSPGQSNPLNGDLAKFHYICPHLNFQSRKNVFR